MSGYSWPLLDARQEHLESRLCSSAALIHRGLAATALVCQHHFAPTERLHAEALLFHRTRQLQKNIFGNVMIECEPKREKKLVAKEINGAVASNKFELLSALEWHRIFCQYVLLASENRE